ncbi:uncharacterized protein LOC126559510 [Anopheles maculipalpis]|uniref:uncharacterized protein LOC126559510 n=1 Tax=Anopheles maculipalpis TaxID=1496333 RepID=UPI002159321A|nr:uncharacterized protein LOC126559510 [Anopheles maculipalpis]
MKTYRGEVPCNVVERGHTQYLKQSTFDTAINTFHPIFTVADQELQNQVDFLRSAHPSGLLTLDPSQQDSLDTKLPFAEVDCKSPEQMMIDETQSVFKVFDY